MEVPPGPEQVQAEAAPEKIVEKVEEKLEEKIEEKRESEFVLAAEPPKLEETPTESQPPAPVTTAPQLPDVQPGPVAAAPIQGKLNVTNSTAIPSWKRQVVGLIERNKRYPTAAQARHEQGTAQLAFSLDRQGRVTASRIIKSSGSTALDAEAMELVKRAQPFPPPPTDLPGAQVDLSVPIRFNIK
jgi:protein TonB